MKALWRTDFLGRIGRIIRFTLWTCFVVNLFMVAVFTVGLTYEFATHLWGWLHRLLFSAPW